MSAMLSGKYLLNVCVNALRGGYLMSVSVPTVAGIY